MAAEPLPWRRWATFTVAFILFASSAMYYRTAKRQAVRDQITLLAKRDSDARCTLSWMSKCDLLPLREKDFFRSFIKQHKPLTTVLSTFPIYNTPGGEKTVFETTDFKCDTRCVFVHVPSDKIEDLSPACLAAAETVFFWEPNDEQQHMVRTTFSKFKPRSQNYVAWFNRPSDRYSLFDYDATYSFHETATFPLTNFMRDFSLYASEYVPFEKKTYDVVVINDVAEECDSLRKKKLINVTMNDIEERFRKDYGDNVHFFGVCDGYVPVSQSHSIFTRPFRSAGERARKWLNSKGWQGDLLIDTYIESILRAAKFVLLIDEDGSDYYIGGRVWRALRLGAVPIYLGGKIATKQLPPKSFVDLRRELVGDGSQLGNLVSKIRMWSSDKELYDGFHEWRTQPSPEYYSWFTKHGNSMEMVRNKRIIGDRRMLTCDLCRWAVERRKLNGLTRNPSPICSMVEGAFGKKYPESMPHTLPAPAAWKEPEKKQNEWAPDQESSSDGALEHLRHLNDPQSQGTVQTATGHEGNAKPTLNNFDTPDAHGHRTPPRLRERVPQPMEGIPEDDVVTHKPANQTSGVFRPPVPEQGATKRKSSIDEVYLKDTHAEPKSSEGGAKLNGAKATFDKHDAPDAYDHRTPPRTGESVPRPTEGIPEDDFDSDDGASDDEDSHASLKDILENIPVSPAAKGGPSQSAPMKGGSGARDTDARSVDVADGESSVDDPTTPLEAMAEAVSTSGKGAQLIVKEQQKEQQKQPSPTSARSGEIRSPKTANTTKKAESVAQSAQASSSPMKGGSGDRDTDARSVDVADGGSSVDDPTTPLEAMAEAVSTSGKGAQLIVEEQQKEQQKQPSPTSARSGETRSPKTANTTKKAESVKSEESLGTRSDPDESPLTDSQKSSKDLEIDEGILPDNSTNASAPKNLADLAESISSGVRAEKTRELDNHLEKMKQEHLKTMEGLEAKYEELLGEEAIESLEGNTAKTPAPDGSTLGIVSEQLPGMEDEVISILGEIPSLGKLEEELLGEKRGGESGDMPAPAAKKRGGMI